MVTGGAEREAGQGWNPYLGALRGSASTPPCPLTIWGTCPRCLRWVMRITRLHQGFTSSQQPAVGEEQR